MTVLDGITYALAALSVFAFISTSRMERITRERVAAARLLLEQAQGELAGQERVRRQLVEERDATRAGRDALTLDLQDAHRVAAGLLEQRNTARAALERDEARSLLGRVLHVLRLSAHLSAQHLADEIEAAGVTRVPSDTPCLREACGQRSMTPEEREQRARIVESRSEPVEPGDEEAAAATLLDASKAATDDDSRANAERAYQEEIEAARYADEAPRVKHGV